MYQHPLMDVDRVFKPTSVTGGAPSCSSGCSWGCPKMLYPNSWIGLVENPAKILD